MAIDNVCSPALIKSGFARCGMFPVNIDVIDKTQINFSDKSRAAMLAESSKTHLCCLHKETEILGQKRISISFSIYETTSVHKILKPLAREYTLILHHVWNKWVSWILYETKIHIFQIFLPHNLS